MSEARGRETSFDPSTISTQGWKEPVETCDDSKGRTAGQGGAESAVTREEAERESLVERAREKAVSSVTCRHRLPFRHRPSHPTPTHPFNNNNNRAGLVAVARRRSRCWGMWRWTRGKRVSREEVGVGGSSWTGLETGGLSGSQDGRVTSASSLNPLPTGPPCLSTSPTNSPPPQSLPTPHNDRPTPHHPTFPSVRPSTSSLATLITRRGSTSSEGCRHVYLQPPRRLY